MQKNNYWSYIGFGILLGIWLSTFISYYTNFENLVVLSIFGGGICFLGFIHYWGKSNGLKKQVEDKSEPGDNSLVKKSRFWKKN